MIHSGLIEKLVSFLSIRDLTLPNLHTKLSHHAINFASFSSFAHCRPAYIGDLNEVARHELQLLRCKQFANTFSRLPFTFYCQALPTRDG